MLNVFDIIIHYAIIRAKFIYIYYKYKFIVHSYSIIISHRNGMEW